MPYLVSSPALARHPSAHLLIILHPALAVLLRTAVARQGGDVDAHAAHGSCECARECCYSRGLTVHKLRRGSVSRAVSQLVVLTRLLWCMERLC